MRVAVLLAAYQGAAFLPAQLDSIAAQRGADWRLVAGDDGSTDATPALLAAFAAAHPGRVELLAGPREGIAAHFRALLGRVGPGEAAAFCDQDDVWHTDKLARGVAALARLDPGRPALYAARTRLVDAAGRPIGLSPALRRPPGFGHALVQNIASGNTMLLNPAAVALLMAADAEAGPVPHHDWWAYQLVTGAGGAVAFDPRPVLDYRQHGGNSIGAAAGGEAALRGIGRLLAGDKRRGIEAASRALRETAGLLTPENRARLEALCAALAEPRPLRRLRLLRASGARMQQPLGTLTLRLALMAGRG